MSKLSDLKKAAADKLATVHTDVAKYVTALEAKVSSNSLTWYAIGAAVVLVGLVIVVHHFKHG